MSDTRRILLSICLAGMIISLVLGVISFIVGINTQAGRSLSSLTSFGNTVFVIPGAVLAAPTVIAQSNQRRQRRQERRRK